MIMAPGKLSPPREKWIFRSDPFQKAPRNGPRDPACVVKNERKKKGGGGGGRRETFSSGSGVKGKNVVGFIRDRLVNFLRFFRRELSNRPRFYFRSNTCNRDVKSVERFDGVYNIFRDNYLVSKIRSYW